MSVTSTLSNQKTKDAKPKGPIKTNDLIQLQTLDQLCTIFSKLNYDPSNENISTKKWKRDIAHFIVDNNIRILARHDKFLVYFCKLTNLLLKNERPIINELLKEHPYSLFIFADENMNNWQWVNAKYDENKQSKKLLRHIDIGEDEKRQKRLHTTTEIINKLTIKKSDSTLQIKNLHEKAFDVRQVTDNFYRDFTEAVNLLAKDIEKRNTGIESKKEALVILNRLVFLYFVQKKRWLDDNQEYLYKTFLKDYSNNDQNYYSDFLIKLFHDLSNSNQLYQAVLGKVPFLNGGLFEVDIKKDRKLKISNQVFKDIYEQLLEVYNFTIQEDTPLEVKIGISPEMLGCIYEKLAIKLEGEYFQKKTGTYYTPPPIVQFMCRESLKEYLVTESKIKRENINQLFDLELNDSTTENVRASFPVTLEQTRQLRTLTKDIRVLDPAVGSGAFLLGMLHELQSVVKKADYLEYGQKHIEKSNYDYELKKELIEKCLYGVDIQAQAVKICELRLWLSLLVDYEKELEKSILPLPNLDCKIRVGDSLLSIERDLFNYQQLDKLEALKSSYFKEDNLATKAVLKNKIDSILHTIANNNEFDFKLYFSEVFEKKINGFDIVIGNPPYVRADSGDEYINYRKKIEASGIYETLYEKWGECP